MSEVFDGFRWVNLGDGQVIWRKAPLAPGTRVMDLVRKRTSEREFRAPRRADV